jgi:hypothetical protein
MIDWRELPSDWTTLPPGACGIYFLVDGDAVAYVGRSKDLRARITVHRHSRSEVKDGRWCVRYYRCRRAQLHRLERECIQHYKPSANTLVPRAPRRQRGFVSAPNGSDLIHAWAKSKRASNSEMAQEIGIPFGSYLDLQSGKRVKTRDLAAVVRWLLSE